MSKWKQFLVVLGLVVGVGAITLPAAPASAINVFPSGCTGQATDAQSVCGNVTDSATSMTKKVVNTMLFILGIVAVIMIIIGGIRYVVSAGDSSAITGAKNTILYSVIGLVVAILAYAIVNFVITTFK
jgi:hypothetical protein